MNLRGGVLTEDTATNILDAADLRFGQVGIASVRVRNDEPAALQSALEVRVREAPQLFARAPGVVDLSFLSPQPASDKVTALLEAVRAAGMLPVGLAWGDNATDELSQRLGLPLIAKFRAAYERRDAAGAGNADTPHRRVEAVPNAPPPPSAATAPAVALQHTRYAPASRCTRKAAISWWSATSPTAPRY